MSNTVNINPDDLLSQFGIDTSNSIRTDVNQRVGEIEVSTPYVEGQAEEVAPIALDDLEQQTIEQFQESLTRVDDFTNEAFHNGTGNGVLDAVIQDDIQDIHIDSLENPIEEDIQSSEELPDINLNTFTKDNIARFSGAEWFEEVQKASIVFAGIGGIGSNAIYNLARLNPNIISIYDDDIVEEVNMAGQMFSSNQIGLTKVDAIRRTIKDYSNYYSIHAHNSRIRANNWYDFSPIMMCGFDNMQAREDYYNIWKHGVLTNSYIAKKDCFFLDARMNAEIFQIFCFTGDDAAAMKKYEEECLFDDSQVEEAICSYKQTSFCATMIGSLITNLFVNFISNKDKPIMVRSLPFKIYYDAIAMYFKAETV